MTSPDTGHEGPHQGSLVMARATCYFPGGKTRRLLATGLNLDGAFLLHAAPPPVNTSLVVTLCPNGLGQLPPIAARVHRTRVDSKHPERNGMGILFTHLDRWTARQLCKALGALGRMTSSQDLLEAVERRIHPRVPVNLNALVETPATKATLKMLNLSLSGALLAADDSDCWSALIPGTELLLHIFKPSGPEKVTVNAEVIRICKGDDPGSFAVRFLDLDKVNRDRLEGLVLDSLTD